MGTRRLRIQESFRNSGGREVAAALQYDAEKDRAPRVVAVGKGKVAAQILALARENNVPIYDDPNLTAALSAVNPGDEIPPELYLVVAKVLAYIYRVAGNRPR